MGTDPIDVQPRRVRCRGCKVTQILLPAALQPRRADSTEVIGIALARKANDLGYRRIAVALRVSPGLRSFFGAFDRAFRRWSGGWRHGHPAAPV
ncbi:RNA polymerase sigma factor, sigma-70 family domain protein [Mycobacterium kansasii 732]|uniref:hypothetical protein n=1 Tax=Mycobacterium pseudokansasii TaxID=2341080 RepID=UPI000447E15D|nr:hypothetical protein [Mycobacterium pseudokansasii]EUA15220.1 RNA polymerase sigma factor, sigma-70 family domain protein [Mycobacterium kansasii 732]KZS62512.1 hypothetical protein A4G27_17740 [Mycobacterium kansasii]